MRLTVILDPENKFRNRLFYGNRLILSGNNGLDEIVVKTKGKKALISLSLTDFNLIVEPNRCPESHRYALIRQNFGNRTGLDALEGGLNCELLEVSALACDGCPKRPGNNGAEPFTAK